MQTKNSKKVLSIILALVLVLSNFMGLDVANVNAEVTTYTIANENFSTLGKDAAATLPPNWKVSKDDANAQKVGTYSAAATTTGWLIGGSNISSTAGNGIYNLGLDADYNHRAVGFLSSSKATKSGNLYYKWTNESGSDLNNFNISYAVEKFRNGSNAVGFTVSLHYSLDGDKWTAAGSDFNVSYAADADNNGAAIVPISTQSISNKPLNISLSKDQSIYFAWNYSVTSGTTTSSAQLLGITNVLITAEGAGSGTPSDTVSNVVATPDNSAPVASGTLVTLSTSTSNATIYYSVDNSSPTLAYSAPIQLNFNENADPITVKALAKADGLNDSEVSTWTFTQAKVANVTASPASSAVYPGAKITLSTATSGATSTYKLNDGAETPYTGPITLSEGSFVDGTATIKAAATKAGYISSDEATFTYTLKPLPDIITAAEAKTKAANAEVRVKGIVTYSTQGRTIFMQDASGGICVDSGSSSVNISGNVGKEIDVLGTISLYGGMVQVKPYSINNIIITNEAPTMPDPISVSINTLNNSNRAYEGQLIKVVDARIKTIGTGTGSTFNHIVTQGTDEITLRAGALAGKAVGDYITIKGVAGYYNSPQIQANPADVIAGAAPPVESVTASPANNSALPIGGTVTLSTATAGASIVYTLNGGAEQTIDSNSGTVTIDQFNQTGDKAIIIAKATKDGYYTVETTFTYSQAKAAPVTASPTAGAISGTKYITLTAAPGATIKYILTKKEGLEGEVNEPEATYTAPIQITETMLPVSITAYATESGYLQSDNATFKYYLASNAPYKNYFGQLHSHTTNSDGAGTLNEAFVWARDNAKLDFFAVTDHSNSFDTANKDDKAGTYNLGAYNKNNEKWQAGRTAAAAAAVPGKFISFYGFEMTWSGGPGHMNTFNTEGFVSRNNTELNNKSNNAGLRAYYDLLKLHPESVSQFNHPGTTFGNFSNFGYYDPVIDERITLIEVGNGEGAIGSGGYFPSYEQYDMALDKGWHVAPTNNQDNHKAMWGNSNTARTVVYTNDFTELGIYQAMKEMRVYATEDANLDIIYTVNDEKMGTILDTVPAIATFKVDAKNVAGTNKIKSISIITNGGVEAYKQNFGTKDAALNYNMTAPQAGYYYIKVVQEDGRIAVTAPVWLGKADSVGISGLTSSSSTPVTTEELTLTTEVFNNEASEITVNSVKYQIKGGDLIADNTLDSALAASSTMKHTQKFTPAEAKKITILVTVSVKIKGVDKAYTKEIELNVKDITKLKFIGIDASHLNEYVAGNYKDSMKNFSTIAMQYGLRTVVLKTSEEFINAAADPKYQMFIITAPTRRLDPASGITHKYYSNEEIAAIAGFAKQGKPVVITGWGDYYESYAYVEKVLEKHMAGQQNKLLAAIGASLRVGDDEAKDDVTNGGQSPRLYLDDHNGKVSPLLSGMLDGQKFSQYGGSTVYAVNPDGSPASTLPASVTPIVNGHSTTYSADDDKDGYGLADPVIKLPRYGSSPDAGKGVGKVLLAASETVNHGNDVTSQVIVAGGAFLSDFEIKNTALDNPADAYSNEVIVQNLLKSIENITVTPIADVKAAAEGTEFTIEGIATVSVYDGSSGNNTGFFDSIYVQDATGGINLFPVANEVQAGHKIRVTGVLSAYQGEKQLAVSSVKILDRNIVPVTPTVVSTKAAMEAVNTGKLIKTTGVVKRVVAEPNGTINEITIDDGTGPAIVYINAYITPNKSLSFVTVGSAISVIGLGSVGENFTSTTEFLSRIRVRDRGEIELVSETSYTVTFDKNGGDTDANPTTKAVVPGGNVGALPTAPTRTGYTFAEWNTAANGSGTAFTATTAVSGDITVYAQWTQNPYTVTFDKNGGTTDASPITKTVVPGGNVGTLPTAPTRTGYTFVEWNTAANGSGTAFTATTVVNGDITVYARWSLIVTDDESDDKSPITPVTPPPVTTTPSDDGKTTTVSAAVKPTVNTATGESKAAVTAKEVTDLAEQAKKAEAAGQKSVVEIKVETAAATKEVAVEIPRDAFNKMATETKAEVAIETDLGRITLSEKAVESISSAANSGAITVSIAKVEASTLTTEAQAKVGDRPVFDFTVKAGNSEISKFGGANVEVSIPYTLKAGEKENAVVVYYIDNEGKLQTVGGKYDPKTGTVNFITTHFSKYAVGYNEVNFKDVAVNAWYNEAVGFIAARGITTGTGNGNYSPAAKLNRGEFIVMMMRAYGIQPDTDIADNFSDAGNTYYTGYLAAAKRMGISNGVGSNMFAPGNEITRQEMFTLLYNALKVIGQMPEGTVGKPLSAFSDAEQVASWAKDAMTLFVKTGAISGNDGKLSSTNITTRAEMAQVLYNLLSR